jgi:copper(I)-binding protein
MNASPTHRLRNRAFAITAATTLFFGCSSDGSDSAATDAVETTAESISIELARSPIPAPEQTVTPVLGILVNDSLAEMRVVSATSPVADSVDLLDPGDLVVLPAEGFEVRPDGGFIMEPVGYKLMLNRIDAVSHRTRRRHNAHLRERVVHENAIDRSHSLLRRRDRRSGEFDTD